MPDTNHRIDRRRFLAGAAHTGVGLAIGSSLLSDEALAAPSRAPSSAESRRGADWPLYRHDTALTGTSPGKGRIVTPEVKWEYYLGAPFTPIATDRQAEPRTVDLDGDGKLERFVIDGHTIRVTDLDGQLLWSHTVEGQPLGGSVRVCKLFPDRPGMQILSFYGRNDTGAGEGYCFTFHKGARQGELAWRTGPLTGYYAFMLIVDDIDGDGVPEIVTAPLYRVQIFNGQTGALKSDVTWEIGRNYGIILARPHPGRPQKDLYLISDFVSHVDGIQFKDGRWTHAWGHRYALDNAAAGGGRATYLRVGPNPVLDLDGDGQDEVVYMLLDGSADDRWHLRVRAGATGEVKADVPGIWLWSIADLDGDGRWELVYTPTAEKRPPSDCDLHIGRLVGGKIEDRAVLKRVRPILVNAVQPLSADSMADEGQLDLLRAPLDPSGPPDFFYARKSPKGPFADTICAASLPPQPDTKLRTLWQLTRPGHRLNLVYAGKGEGGATFVRVRDLTAGRLLTLDAKGKVIDDTDLGRPGGFSTTPIVVDLDGDGRNEVVVQNAAGEILAFKTGRRRTDPPVLLWSVPGVAMNHMPGYFWNGALSPQAADIDGDGRPELLFAAEDARGSSSLVCVDVRGKRKWSRSFDACPWGGMQAGVNFWTFGHFTRSASQRTGQDVYVDIHRRAKGSCEGWVLRGDTGAPVWHQEGLVAKDHAVTFGGGVPAIADVNADGSDDLIQEFVTIYGAIAGSTGEPLFPPATLNRPGYFGRWIAFSSPTVADLNGDGRLEVYLNSASYSRGGYAAVHLDGKPFWAEFHDNDEGSDGFGPVGDFDGDGKVEIGVPVLNGTLVCLNGADGSRRWTIRTPVSGDVVAADVNGDGVLELLFSGRDGKLRAVSGKDGRELWSIAAPGRPVVADVDGDGLVEVLAVGSDGMLRVVGPA